MYYPIKCLTKLFIGFFICAIGIVLTINANGICTIISGIGLGYIIQFTFKICKLNTSKIKHRYLIDDFVYIKNKLNKDKNQYEVETVVDNDIE